ncbi:MAG: Mbov_0395 family pilin-like conjugal transfer protein [Candidatus Saccharimonadales bacterium]
MDIFKYFGASNPVIDGAENVVDSTGLNDDLISPVQALINAFIGLIGLVAVIMIILGAVQMQTSQGDSGKVKKARDTMMYGIIGLVIAILAFSIVNFVLASVF